MNTAAWKEAVPSQGCICQLSIIKELEDDLRTWQILFLYTIQQHSTPCSQMLDGTGICWQKQWVLSKDQTKTDAEKELGCFLPFSRWELSLPTDKTGRMPPTTS